MLGFIILFCSSCDTNEKENLCKLYKIENKIGRLTQYSINGDIITLPKSNITFCYTSMIDTELLYLVVISVL